MVVSKFSSIPSRVQSKVALMTSNLLVLEHFTQLRNLSILLSLFHKPNTNNAFTQTSLLTAFHFSVFLWNKYGTMKVLVLWYLISRLSNTGQCNNGVRGAKLCASRAPRKEDPLDQFFLQALSTGPFLEFKNTIIMATFFFYLLIYHLSSKLSVRFGYKKLSMLPSISTRIITVIIE